MPEPDLPDGPYFQTTVLDLFTQDPIHDALIVEADITTTANLIRTNREGAAILSILNAGDEPRFVVRAPGYFETSMVIHQVVVSAYNDATHPFVSYLVGLDDYETMIPDAAPASGARPHLVYLHQKDFEPSSSSFSGPPIPIRPSLARDDEGNFVESEIPGRDGVLLYPDLTRSGIWPRSACLGVQRLTSAAPGFAGATYYLCD